MLLLKTKNPVENFAGNWIRTTRIAKIELPNVWLIEHRDSNSLDDLYFVRLIKRGSRLECTGVYKLSFEGREPRLSYQFKSWRSTQRIMKNVKKWFLETYSD